MVDLCRGDKECTSAPVVLQDHQKKKIRKILSAYFLVLSLPLLKSSFPDFGMSL